MISDSFLSSVCSVMYLQSFCRDFHHIYKLYDVIISVGIRLRLEIYHTPSIICNHFQLNSPQEPSYGPFEQSVDSFRQSLMAALRSDPDLGNHPVIKYCYRSYTGVVRVCETGTNG